MRLSSATIGQLRDAPVLPYARDRLRTGIVHLGIGAFHRAHQGVYTDDCVARGDARWGILGASLRSPAVADQLNPQDGLYTVLVRDGGAAQTRVIGACRGVVVAPQDPGALVAAMAAPDTAIVSLTITEKGYKLDPATGALLIDDEEILSDLAGLHAPRTAVGFLVAALARRKAQGVAPFTALSCDNLPENGARLRHAVTDFAAQHDPALADWIRQHAAFPSTMVDRIVPAATAEDLDAFTARTGLRDEGLVKTEPFSQWVIEDRFCGPRPAWEDVGAQLTSDVRPWELAKLRLLNGAHSAIAYLGGLAGHAHVHDAMAEPAFAAYVALLQSEAGWTLHPPAGLDVGAYTAQLQARFANAALMHKTRQIAMDGSQKIPQRLLASIRTRIDRNQTIDALALAVAGWMRWQAGVDEKGAAFTVEDPLAQQTRTAFEAGVAAGDVVGALTRLEAVFGADLAADQRFLAPLRIAFARLQSLGAAGAVRATLNPEKAA